MEVNIQNIEKRISNMESFFYFLSLNGCKIGQQGFHRCVLKFVKEETVKNLSLEFKRKYSVK